jgi:hypothetical protein
MTLSSILEGFKNSQKMWNMSAREQMNKAHLLHTMPRIYERDNKVPEAQTDIVGWYNETKE